MDNLLDNILEFFQTLDIVYVYIFLGSFAGVLLLNIIIKKVKEIIKKRKCENENSNPNGQVFNYINQCNEDDAVEKNTDTSKVNKKEKINPKIEEARIKAINAYNTLYDLHFNAGYSVNLEHNQVLAYYNSFILGTNDEHDLNFIAEEITTQTQNMYTDMNKQYYDEQKKIYQEKCATQLVELDKLFELASVDGKTVLKKYNEKILLITDFATLEEFQSLSIDIQLNIDYMKDKYSKVFKEKYTIEDTTEYIDAELIKSLKTLHCDPKERDEEKIRSTYVQLIKQCHPDLANGTSINTDLDFKAIASAYDYIKRNLKQ